MQISVRVEAGAKREGVEALPKNRFRIKVKPKAEQGAANERAIELLAKHLKVPISKVRILRGHHSPSKIVSVSD